MFKNNCLLFFRAGNFRCLHRVVCLVCLYHYASHQRNWCTKSFRGIRGRSGVSVVERLFKNDFDFLCAGGARCLVCDGTLVVAKLCIPHHHECLDIFDFRSIGFFDCVAHRKLSIHKSSDTKPGQFIEERVIISQLLQHYTLPG